MAGLQRTMSALSGGLVVPPARGVSFVAPDLVPGVSVSEAPERTLARAYVEAGLDFAFVPSWERWAGMLAGLLRDSDIAVLWVVPGVLWPTLESVGVGEGLRSIARDPDSLGSQLDAAAEAMLDAVALGVGSSADAIVVAEDLAGETGLLISSDFVSDHVFRRLTRAVEAASRTRTPVLLHSDGDISVLLPAVRDAGFAGVHAGGSTADAFERFHADARHARLAVVGGLTARALGTGLPAAVLAGIRLAILAKSGGLLIADDGGITTAGEYVALLAALKAARE